MEIMEWKIKFLQPLLGATTETFNHLLKTGTHLLFGWAPVIVAVHIDGPYTSVVS